MPLISIITACYNQGFLLEDAIKSIELEKYKNIFEHIIINDGSTDEETLEKLKFFEKNGSIVFNQKNQGLGAARNKGISIASGKYILPLDCDNMIDSKVFIEAALIMEKNNSINVVYTDAEYFGDKKGLWKVGKYSIPKLLFCNYIDACALMRKKIFDESGKYDIRMPAMGHEDWELWGENQLN